MIEDTKTKRKQAFSYYDSALLISENQTHLIGHVQYINIQAWLRGFRVKIANFSSFFCSSIPKRDLDTKKTTPNMDVWPESLGAMLEYWYIERGLFSLQGKWHASNTLPDASHSEGNLLT